MGIAFIDILLEPPAQWALETGAVAVFLNLWSGIYDYAVRFHSSPGSEGWMPAWSDRQRPEVLRPSPGQRRRIPQVISTEVVKSL